jgi:aspartyl-tRNA(Asn)/glutamyl-tRNA(Gln) amidotransferase subunit A
VDFLNLNIFEKVQALKQKKISAVEICQLYADRIDRLNPQLNAVVAKNPAALAQAQKIDEKINRAESVGALAGLQIGLKDNICVKALPVTAASKILKNFVSPYDATLVQKLNSAGAVVSAKLNMDEFAMGSSNETSIPAVRAVVQRQVRRHVYFQQVLAPTPAAR